MAALLNVKQFVRFDEHGNLHVPNKLFVACQAYVQTPFLNDTSSRVATTEWVRAQISSLTGVTLSETDPIWVFEKALYYTKLQADARYLQSFTETDPTVSAWAKASVKPTYTFAELLSKPTTIAGYGITDIPTTLPASDVYAWAKAATKPSYAYSEITGKPTLFSGVYADLTGKPTLFSGSYTDLTNKPTIPAAQVNSDWNATTGLAQILNKPSLFSGAYTDLTGKPTIPTNNNQLTNGAGYLTSYTETDPIWTSEKTNYALKTYVDTSISNLVASAPAALNTLNELALALGSDANFSTTVTTLIGTKEPSITAGTTLQYFRGDKTFQTLPIYTLSGLGGEPTIAAGTTAQYWRGDKSWQTLPVYTLPTASTTVLGGVKVDGTTITISAGVISGANTYTLPTASTTVLGGVKVDGTTITIASGVISGANTYSLPIASATVLGGIKVGTNLSINATTGVLSSTDTTYAIFTGATTLVDGTTGLVTKPLIANRLQYLRGDGTWGTPPDTDTTYVVFTRTANGLVPTAPTGTGTSKYLREDGSWVIPPDTDTVYTHPTTAGNKHIPSGGAAGQILRWSADGTAVWGADTDTNTWDANSKDVAGYVAAPGAVANKVWKTDGSGNPGWRDDADTVVTSLAWTSITGRPTALSSFTNDLGNYGSWYSTSGGTISGNVTINGTTNTPLSVRAVEPYMEVVATGASNTAGLAIKPTSGYDAVVGNYNGGSLNLMADSTLIAKVTRTTGVIFYVGTTGPITALGTNSSAYNIFVNSSSSNKTWDISMYGNDWILNESNVTSRLKVLAGGGVYADSFFEFSDKRFKQVVKENPDFVGIESVTAKHYIKEGKEEVGYFAQDFEGVLNSAILKDKDGILSLSYRQVHTAKIAVLEKRVAELEAKLNTNV